VQSGTWSCPSKKCEDKIFENIFRRKELFGGGEELGLVGLGVAEAGAAQMNLSRWLTPCILSNEGFV